MRCSQKDFKESIDKAIERALNKTPEERKTATKKALYNWQLGQLGQMLEKGIIVIDNIAVTDGKLKITMKINEVLDD